MGRGLQATFLGRGLQEHSFSQASTIEVRRYNAKQLQHHDPWEIGLALGFFAQKFEARAPLHWISHQLFRDCTWVNIVDGDVVLNYEHGHSEIVDIQFFSDLNDGIDTGLYDWWLSDIDFLDYEEFKEWRDVTEDNMAWELIEFWETWLDVDCDGIFKDLSAKEKLLCDRAENKLLVEHEKMRAAIEAEAVRLGL